MAEARPSNLSSMQIEIKHLKVDMTATLATPIALPQTTPWLPIVDLFASEEPIQTFLEKRLCTDKEPEERNIRAKL